MNRPTPTSLVVLNAFGRYSRGDLIVDPVTILAILSGGNAKLVLIPVLPVINPVAVAAPISTLTSMTEH